MAGETPDDKPNGEPGLVGAWLEAIDNTEREEDEWRKSALKASETYRGDTKSRSRNFNIFHSNVEILVPALYNSTPSPDVRRRYNDDDKASKAGADLIERSLSYSVDMYDFDGLMLSCVKDMVIADRGVARVKYLPTFVGEGEEQVVGYEEARCEYVPWGAFRRGPARTWGDVSWLAFEHFLGKAEIEKLNPRLARNIAYGYSAEAKSDAKKQSENLPRFGKRARVWEIWDKDEAKVHWIAPDHGRERIAVMDDPLGLKDFFPCPRPMQAIGTPDSLVPVTMYSIFADLVDELNIVTRRIAALVKQLRPRGWYAGITQDLQVVANANDGELVPMTGADAVVGFGKASLEQLISWFPLDPVSKAIEELRVHREQIKQTIYEVTGVADILRGSSNPNETLGAQQIKAQMGSMRVQALQREVQRFARDLFRLKAEMICSKFSFDTLSTMTGLRYPSAEEKAALEGMKQQYEAQAQRAQAAGQPVPPPPIPPEELEKAKQALESPTREEVETILRDDAVRGYRIDIESDSTVRGDVMRNTQQMGTFVQGLGGFFQAVGPAVEAGAMPKDVGVEMVAAFARQMKLGKQAEDAIDRWADAARKESAAPQQPKPDPNAEKLKLEMERTKAKMEADKQAAEMKQQSLSAELEAQQQRLGMERETAALDHDLKRQGIEMDMQALAAEHHFGMRKLGADVQAAQAKAMMPAPRPSPAAR